MLISAAVGYPLTLAALALAFYYVGESWWLTAAALYVPRLLFAVPLPFLLILLTLRGLRRLLWTQLLALVILLIPIMGLVLPWPAQTRGKPPSIRVLSFNVDSCYAGVQTIADSVAKNAADIVLLQEANAAAPKMRDALRPLYRYTETSNQFVIASRFPIVSSAEPERVLFDGRKRSPRSNRSIVETPFGNITFYNVHPISPRGMFHMDRFRNAFRLLHSRELLSGDAESYARGNAGLRARQIEAVAQSAASEPEPVVIAGDTNLPGLSASVRRSFGQLSDGFVASSWGFGYTFPAKHPFLRLDRIFVGPQLAVVAFHVGCAGASDHLCVVADLERR